MKRILLLALALLMSVLCLAQTQAPASILIHAKINSETLGTYRNYAVYLPAEYESSTKNYPVLYLLHGAWDDFEGWVKNGNAKKIADQIIAEGFASPMIIVMPEGSGQGKEHEWKNQGYYNRPDWSYEDFFFKEFIPYLEENYRMIGTKQSRAIAGLSMGGGGSASYALRYPDMFGSACSLSGALGSIKSLDSLSPANASPLAYISNATPEQVDAIRTVRWFVDCGDDDFLWEANIEFYKEMKRKGVPLQYRMRDGTHDWEYWQTSLPDVLRFVSVGFAQ